MRPSSTALRCVGLVLASIACAVAATAQTASEPTAKGKRASPALKPPLELTATPAGSGASNTGFVSTNVAKRPAPKPKLKMAPVAKRGRPAPPPKLETPASPPRRTVRRAEEDDAYAPVGVRFGGFVLRPTVDLSTGYDDNPFRTAARRGSRFSVVAAKVETQSLWSRHELAGELRGSFSKYHDVAGNDRPEAEAKLRGRIDATSTARIELEGRAALTTQAAGSPDTVASARRPPEIYALAGKAGYVQRFNRFELGTHGEVERTTYQDAILLSGAVRDQSDRNFTAYGARLRGGYELTPGIKPFLEGAVDTRVFDNPIDSGGVRRGSDGVAARAGVSFERPRLLKGDVSAGYARRRYRDPGLDDIGGLIVDASLVWTASPLTQVTLKALSEIGETTLTGSSGVFRREASVAVEHAFRRWLIGSVSVAYGFEDYQGVGRRDDRVRFAAGILYYLNPFAALRGEVRREQFWSTAPNQDYTANIALIGLRLQR